MQCADAIEALRGLDAEARSEASQHAASCRVCAPLDARPDARSDSDGSRNSMMRPATPRFQLDAALQALDVAVVRERGALAWLRNRSTTLRRAVALAAVALTSLSVLVATPRADLAVYPVERMALLTVLWAALLGVFAWHTLPSDARPHPSPRSIALGVVAALFAAWLPTLLPLAHSAHPASLGGTGAELWPRALPCFEFGLGIALPTAAVAWLASRGSRRLTALPLSLFAGAGLSGLFALHLHCPLVHPEHLALGHASVPLVLVLVGVVLRLASPAGRPSV